MLRKEIRRGSTVSAILCRSVRCLVWARSVSTIAAAPTYSPDGKIIVTANGDEVTFWDPATSKILRQLKLENQREIVGLIFSHDRKKLAAIGWGGTSIHVWDLETFNKLKIVQSEGGGQVVIGVMQQHFQAMTRH